MLKLSRGTGIALVMMLYLVPAHAAGPLLIAGGAIREDNEAVYGAFIAGLAGEGPVVVIPAAGDSPVKSGAYFTSMLAARGIAAERVRVFPVALRDDASTAETDERQWSGNAARPELLRGLENAAGFWFSGGDQMRIVRTLRAADGGDTPLLALIRARHAAGAVVGGSSAGAAIMSETMISIGHGFRALLEPLAPVYPETDEEDTGRLFLARGLGFFAYGIVDQHFDREARLGRLVRALAESRAGRGFGVDEDTAMLVENGSVRVLGSGGVTVVDARGARFDMQGRELAVGMQLALFPAGVRFDAQTLQPLEGAGDALAGHESSAHRPLDGGGMGFPNPRLEQALAHDLLDNRHGAPLQRYGVDGAGRVLVFRFEKTVQSRGWWREVAGADRYTATGVGFAVHRATLPAPH